jgi:hypothetical protein
VTSALLFLAGVLVGALPIVRRALETLRWSYAIRVAWRNGIQVEDLTEGDLLDRLTEATPKTRPLRLRRAK